MSNEQKTIEYKSPQKTMNDALNELMEICDKQKVAHAGACVILTCTKVINALDILLKQDKVILPGASPGASSKLS